MDPMEAENLLRKLDRRLQNVEQILPTLPTREEMREAIAEAARPLATREDLRAGHAILVTREELNAIVATLATKAQLAAAIAPLATRAEVSAQIREEGERTRRHFDIVGESLRDDIRLIAESQVALQAEVRQDRKELSAILKNHEKRITRLEVSDARKRARKNR